VRAVALDSEGRPELVDLPEPDGAGLLVRVRACGLCGSDVEKLGRACVNEVRVELPLKQFLALARDLPGFLLGGELGGRRLRVGEKVSHGRRAR